MEEGITETREKRLYFNVCSTSYDDCNLSKFCEYKKSQIRTIPLSVSKQVT